MDRLPAGFRVLVLIDLALAIWLLALSKPKADDDHPLRTTPSASTCQGYRMMVQVQSSWFPVVIRNSQTFVDICTADENDYRSEVNRVHRTSA